MLCFRFEISLRSWRMGSTSVQITGYMLLKGYALLHVFFTVKEKEDETLQNK